ncbi:MAG: UDP-2,4-diacetamido-2,4,6-trideoxy-beta-L-altropyranose hydrolase [Oscillatoria sp. SIO1A7]|nr:UDP-2,4-diacetamido-2,4,6-trideoxy-beta-L-altropyranose hydrolase [Oscillatoria sp. SIO1A7]
MNLLIRTDANTQIGTGHLMRCMALSQFWQDACGSAIFVMATEAPMLEKRLKSEQIQVVRLSVKKGSPEDAKETANLAQRLNASWVVVDGYHFDAQYQQIIKDRGLNLLFIDDCGQADRYHADIVLNQNIYAHEGLYANREPYTQLLLGTRYTLLRREFWPWQGWQRESPMVARKILVTLGGADADNVTLKAIQALQRVEVEELQAEIVVGASNPHQEQLQWACQNSRFPICLKQNVANMPELMARADLAIAAGGSTTWELAFMGLPSLVLILADNQRSIAEKLGAMGAVVNLGWHEDVSLGKMAREIGQLLISSESRLEMASLGRQLVDGEGGARVSMHLEGKLLRLRSVRNEDCGLLWKWANEPDVRAASFSSEPISWETHVQWLGSKLRDPNCIFYIAVNREDVPIGQIRYDLERNREAVVSICIGSKFRNRGYGSQIIAIACQKLFNVAKSERISAYIKPGNQASRRAFVKAGFQEVGTRLMRGGIEAIHLVKVR